MAKNNSVYVFCYGTLKKHEPNADHMNNKENGTAEFIGQGKTKEKYALVVSSRFNLPFLLDQPGTGKHVIGEVYQVDDKMLSWLDWFEDHPDLYVRREITVTLEGGQAPSQEYSCWAYMLKDFPAKLTEVKEHLENYLSVEHTPCYIPEEDDAAPDNFYDALLTEVESSPSKHKS